MTDLKIDLIKSRVSYAYHGVKMVNRDPVSIQGMALDAIHQALSEALKTLDEIPKETERHSFSPKGKSCYFMIDEAISPGPIEQTT